MADTFTPPPLDSHQGPAAGFVPPPVSAHQGPAPDPNQGKYAHSGYKSSLPWPLNKVDEATSDTINAMAEGLNRVLHGDTPDERLGGASQILHGFANSAGVPLVME